MNTITTLDVRQQKVNEIAQFLGAMKVIQIDEWDNSRFEICLGEMAIRLSFTEDGRVIVYALEWPHDRWGKSYYYPNGGDFRLEITVSAKRPSREIAGEIQRRLLPKYTRLFKQCLAQRDEDEQYRLRVYTNARELASIIGADVTNMPEGASQYELYADIKDPVDPTDRWVKIMVSANRVDILVRNLGLEQAKELVTSLKDLFALSQCGGLAR